MLTHTFLETDRNNVLGDSTFTALSVIASLGQCHSCCPSKPFSRTYPVEKSL